MPWSQEYNPLHQPVLSTGAAALPVVILLGLLASGRVRAWWAALYGLASASIVAVGVFGMPIGSMVAAAVYGAAYGMFPIGWIIINVLFLHRLTVQSGRFEDLRQQLSRLAPDPRVQVILIAFCFGAFVEGAAGFGAPVAITAALLLQLGFSPLHASGLALIANTAPVAFGSLGIPLITLQQVTGLDLQGLSSMAGRQLPPFSAMIPTWIVMAYGGWPAIRAVWPISLTAGLVFALVQFLVSNFHGPWLVDPVAALASLGATLLVARAVRPGTVSRSGESGRPDGDANSWVGRSPIFRPWMPWSILMVFIFVWGIPEFKKTLDGWSSPHFPVPALDLGIRRMPPVVSEPRLESVQYRLNWLSATGTGVWLAAMTAGLAMGRSPLSMIETWFSTWYQMRFPLLTIAAMLALGNVTKFSGADATLGLALAGTGIFYPFFGTLLGWLGVALTGSDTASNVLFGSLQQVTANQLGISPYLMASANSTGGVMGKMVDAQSIVVAGAATESQGMEGRILRFVLPHSLCLAILMGLWVALLAGVAPLKGLVIQ